MNSDVASLDFAEADSVRKVNEWVANMTGGKIDDLVDSFSADTTLFIANALYFNEKWEIPFMDKDPVTGNKLTGDFQKADSGFVNVPFIEQRSSQIGYQLINNTNLGVVVFAPDSVLLGDVFTREGARLVWITKKRISASSGSLL